MKFVPGMRVQVTLRDLDGKIIEEMGEGLIVTQKCPPYTYSVVMDLHEEIIGVYPRELKEIDPQKLLSFMEEEGE